MKYDHRPPTADRTGLGFAFDAAFAVAFDVILRRSFRRRIRRPSQPNTEPDSSVIRLPQNDVKYYVRCQRILAQTALSVSLCLCGEIAFAQAPRINTFFP